VRLLTDQSGTSSDPTTYDPFGVQLRGTGPFGFTGEPSTASGKLLHLRARDYNPVLGRFLTPDPAPPTALDPQSFNPYSYVLNNPVNLVDPAGTSALEAIG